MFRAVILTVAVVSLRMAFYEVSNYELKSRNISGNIKLHLFLFLKNQHLNLKAQYTGCGWHMTLFLDVPHTWLSNVQKTIRLSIGAVIIR